MKSALTREILLEMHAAKMSDRAIARKLGFSFSAVFRARKALDIPAADIEPQIGQHTVAVNELLIQGMERKAIAARLGIPIKTVDGYTSRARAKGLIPPPPAAGHKASKVEAMTLAGLSPQQIMEQTDIGSHTITRVRARMKADGIQLPTKPKPPRAKIARIAKAKPIPAPSKARVPAARAADIIPTAKPNAQLIAEYLAINGAKRCPTVALNPTQAHVCADLTGRDPWQGQWPASNGKQKSRAGRKGAMRNLQSVRMGSVI